MTDRVLIGKHPDTGVVGMWISKPGFDARTDTNSDNFLFDPSKYMARAYARVISGAFTRGAFIRTITYADGTRQDNYYWEMIVPLPFGYVPLVIAQLGPEMTSGDAAFPGLCYYTASSIVLRTGGMATHIYNGSDPSKTPIGGYANSATWHYDLATDTMNFVAANKSSFIIYRNPLF